MSVSGFVTKRGPRERAPFWRLEKNVWAVERVSLGSAQAAAQVFRRASSSLETPKPLETGDIIYVGL